ncbi:hypothetical protein RchiOBHm_Chr6g0254591 [Rosa chinensis]|uniref:Uncharacterized protein n=1 Tax=Rosa chinensis TaxID=74649 RepID=A0A2P6PLN1_ROSCH|nr:hypothetical protein RchiOBHm_Chr6g0254591 [Rosa chinensis]
MGPFTLLHQTEPISPLLLNTHYSPNPKTPQPGLNFSVSLSFTLFHYFDHRLTAHLCR